MSGQFIRGIENFSRTGDRPIVATIGTFDGIHIGHQEILRAVTKIAKEQGADPLLITFHPHPRILVTPGEAPLLLTSIEEKAKFVPHFFDGNVLVLDFNEELMGMSHEQFVKEILVDKLKISSLIVGYDHHFGKDRKGNASAMNQLGSKYGFDVQVIEPILIDGTPVSSTRIRRALTDQSLASAVSLLGHDYAIYGTVERGIGMGCKLGYPTANVKYSQRKLLPLEGVYVCKTILEESCYFGMMFIGRNYLNPEVKVSVEANLFDFDRDIYDWEIIVFPTHFIRKNQRFKSTDGLIKQIGLDKLKAKEIIKQEKLNVVDQQRA